MTNVCSKHGPYSVFCKQCDAEDEAIRNLDHPDAGGPSGGGWRKHPEPEARVNEARLREILKEETVRFGICTCDVCDAYRAKWIEPIALSAMRRAVAEARIVEVTDEMVERAARTHFKEFAERTNILAAPWGQQDESDRADWLNAMRASLQSALTDKGE